MDCTRVLVRPVSRLGWVIEDGAREMGPYHCREMALRIAILEALSVRRAGQPVRVAIENDEGTTVAKRCLCSSFGR